MSRTIYVANLGHRVGQVELERLFASHGQVRSAEVVNQLAGADITGTGHVEMGSDAAAAAMAAIAAMNGARYGDADLIPPGRAWTAAGDRPAAVVRVDEHPRPPGGRG